MQHIGPLVNSAFNSVTPLLKESCFETHGMLMPEEFVIAGDELVTKCGTWKWSSCHDDSKLSYLPKEKQFLVCHSVPEEIDNEIITKQVDFTLKSNNCNEKNDFDLLEDDESWENCQAIEKTTNLEDTFNKNKNIISKELNNKKDLEYEEDLDCEDEDNCVYEDTNIIKTCRYDVSITYNNYYRTPQFWIIGYNLDESIMSPLDLLNRVSSEHTNKTATVENHPHTNIRQLSIHPCRHSETMKTLIKLMKPKNGFQSAMFIYLKMISTIMPHLKYDFTISI